jgi:hypothetical protein
MTLNLKSSRSRLWWIVAGIGLVATGCGDDQQPSRLDDLPLPCTPVVARYRIDHADPSVARAQTIDLDGDAHPDDGLGQAHDFLATFAPEFAVADRLADRLGRDLPWAITTFTCGNDIRVAVDTVGGLEPTGFEAPRAAGMVNDGAIQVRDGIGHLPLRALADAVEADPDPGWTAGDALTMHATITGDGLEGVFALALPTETVRAELAAPIAEFLTAQPADNGLRAATDNDHDGIVTAAEVAATPAYQGIMSSDLSLVIDDQPQTSVAFRFTAKRM